MSTVNKPAAILVIFFTHGWACVAPANASAAGSPAILGVDTTSSGNKFQGFRTLDCETIAADFYS